MFQKEMFFSKWEALGLKVTSLDIQRFKINCTGSMHQIFYFRLMAKVLNLLHLAPSNALYEYPLIGAVSIIHVGLKVRLSLRPEG
jgi:hypothetical protein